MSKPKNEKAVLTLTDLQQRAIARLHPLVTVQKTPAAMDTLALAAFGLALWWVPNVPGKSLPISFAVINLSLLGELGIEVAAEDHDEFARTMCEAGN